MPFLTRYLLPFLIGFASFLKIELGGSLSVSEILLLISGPFYVEKAIRLAKHKQVRNILILGILYLISLMIADIYRVTPAEDYIRGWLRIGITLISMLVLGAMLSQDRGGWLSFLLGWVLTPIGSILVYGLDYEFLYKFYVGQPLSAIAFLGLGYAPVILSPIAQALAVLAIALAFFSDSRSLAGVTALAYIAIVMRARGIEIRAWSKVRLFTVGVLLCVAGYGILSLYVYAAPRGYLGDIAYEKYLSQVRPGDDGILTVLFSGRVEIFFTWPKIVESPIIGYGSWPKDWIYTQGRASELQIVSLGALLGSKANVDLGLIPSHSHIMGAWLEAGILGAVFWGYALWLALTTLFYSRTEYAGKLAPLFTFILVNFIWDLFFSPYSGERRLWDGFVLAWIVSVGSQASAHASETLMPNRSRWRSFGAQMRPGSGRSKRIT